MANVADAAVVAGEDLRDELRAPASELEVEQLRLEREVEALRADVLAIDDPGQFAAALAARDTRIADLDRHRREVAAAIDCSAPVTKSMLRAPALVGGRSRGRVRAWNSKELQALTVEPAGAAVPRSPEAPERRR